MKKVETQQLSQFLGGSNWYEILDCLMDIAEVADVELYTALELCALSEKYPIT